MKNNLTAPIAGLTVALSLSIISCNNPADETTDAQVSEEQAVALAAASSETYTFAESSTIKFTGSKVTGSQSGSFKSFSGSFKVADGAPVSGAFTIDMDSITTEKEKLTKHLKDADFFNVPQFPKSTFEVTEFAKNTNGYDLSGNLTMLGITKNITFPAAIEQTENTVKLTSKFDINRQQWGINYEGRKDDLIRDEFVLELSLIAEKEVSE